VLASDRPRGECSLRLPGSHNVKNALAALAVADYLKIDFQKARDTLARFQGVARRFEVKGEAAGVTVIDDYAHHPSEIHATLAAARERYPGRRIWALFQPHTYSRTKALFQGFASALAEADQVVVTDIYPARESDDLGVDSAQLVAAINSPRARHIGDLKEAAHRLSQEVEPGDILITMGAGDIWEAGEEILSILREKGR